MLCAVGNNFPYNLCLSHDTILYSIQSFSPVRELRADQVLALGSLVTEMAERELQDAGLTDLGVLAHLGTLTGWSPKKVKFIFHSLISHSNIKLKGKKMMRWT